DRMLIELRLDEHPVARREPAAILTVLRSDPGIDRLVPVGPGQRITPVREQERRVLGERALIRRRRGTPMSLHDGSLALQKCSQCRDRARGYRSQAWRRGPLALP